MALVGTVKNQNLNKWCRKTMPKNDVEKIDGLSPKDVEKIRRAIRQVWSWSWPRKLCIKRATGKDGFPRCEKCKRKVPKVYPDHITPVGDVDAGFISRLFCSSKKLQALCKKCHDRKTREERKEKSLKALGL